MDTSVRRCRTWVARVVCACAVLGPVGGARAGTPPFAVPVTVEKFELPGTSLQVSGPPERIAAGDMNGDGRDDLVYVRRYVSRVVRAALSIDGTTFAEPVTIGHAPGNDVAIVDLDGSAPAELLVAYDDAIGVWRWDGSAFVQRATIGVGGVQLEIGDVDGDGDADVFVGGPLLSVLRNDGGVLSHALEFDPLEIGDTRFAVGDLDGDGRADVATATGAFRSTGVAFEEYAALEMPDGGEIACIGDVDGDGDGDVLLQGTVSRLLRNDAAMFPTFDDGEVVEPRPRETGTARLHTVTLADVDLDGALDVLVGVWNATTDLDPGPIKHDVHVGRNENGTFVFRAPAHHAGGLWPTALAAGDFDGNGRPDIATHCRGVGILAIVDGAQRVEHLGSEVSVLLSGASTISRAMENVLPLALNDYTRDPFLHDVNADGRPDLVALVYQHFTHDLLRRFEIRLGMEGGVFDDRPVHVEQLTGPGARLRRLDVDGNGTPELVDTTWDRVLVASDVVPPARFASEFALTMVEAPWAGANVGRRIAYGDFTGDGQVDVIGMRYVATDDLGDLVLQIAPSEDPDAVSIAGWLGAPFRPSSIAAQRAYGTCGDFDGDGDLDVLVQTVDRTIPPDHPLADLGRIFVARNDGAGRFTTTVDDLTCASPPNWMVVADFDADGRDEVLNLVSAAQSILAQPPCEPAVLEMHFSPDCTIDSVTEHPVDHLPTDIDVIDLDADGRLDIVLTLGRTQPGDGSLGFGDHIELWHNQGDGTFESESFRLPTTAQFCDFADLDGDGRPELASTEPSLGGISIARNQLAPGCTGDANGDRVVNLADLDLVLFHYGTVVDPGRDGDVDADGTVGVQDLLTVLAEWTRSCE